MRRTLLKLALLAIVSSCSSPEPEESLLTAALVGGDEECTPSRCGNSNSPVVDGVLFWVLNALHQPNPQGVKIVHVWRSDGEPMHLTTAAPGDRLIGYHPITGEAAAGTALKNTRIELDVQGTPYEIRIDDVSPSWGGDKLWVSADKVETYLFRYSPSVPYDPRNSRPLCTPEVDSETAPEIRAIVFRRDLYDPTTKALYFENEDWFNVACSGGAPYKMHMIGYTQVAQGRLNNSATSTTPAARQAMFNAFTMNACGTGEAFTVHGEPLTLSESLDMLPATDPYRATMTVSSEAIWGPGGAVCLDTPRLANHRGHENIRDEIEIECGRAIPRCDRFAWPGSGHVKTGNPAEPPNVIVPR
jgi:hypothetical protein